MVASRIVTARIRRGEGTASQVWMGGTPSQVERGGYPSQVWMGGDPILLTRGCPIQYQDGGGTLGYSSVQDWMVYPPCQQNGVPPIQDWMGYPPPCQRLNGVTPPPPISKVSTCYAVTSVPLAFTQKDFLVNLIVLDLADL